MNPKKILYLTSVNLVPSEKGNKKIDSVVKKPNKNSDDTLPKSWFIENNLKPPPDAEDYADIDNEGRVILDDEDLEYQFYDYLVDYSEILEIQDTLEFGSIITLKNSLREIHVEESVEEIYGYIYTITLPWFDKFKNSISQFFARKKKINLDKSE